MGEVQQHGLFLEDRIIFELTNLTKNEYNQVYDLPYNSKYDLLSHEKYKIKNPISIKTTKSDNIGCGDLQRFVSCLRTDSFKMLVGQYKQIGTKKQFFRIIEFDFNPKHSSLILGNVPCFELDNYCSFIKSIEPGKSVQLKSNPIWKNKLQRLNEKFDLGLLKINTKIDSKSQRRVQCSLSISELVYSKIPLTIHKLNYLGVNLPIEIYSKPRTFKKSRSVLYSS